MISARRFLRLVVTILVVAIAGCSAFQHRSDQEWTGKFSVSSVFQGKAERDSGTFVLSRNKGDLELVLKGPLGAAAAIVEETPSGATLKIPNEEPITAKTSSQLAQRLIGVPVGLQDIARWLETGVPRAEELERRGWKVVLEKQDNQLKNVTVEREESPYSPYVKLILLPSQTK